MSPIVFLALSLLTRSYDVTTKFLKFPSSKDEKAQMSLEGSMMICFVLVVLMLLAITLLTAFTVDGLNLSPRGGKRISAPRTTSDEHLQHLSSSAFHLTNNTLNDDNFQSTGYNKLDHISRRDVLTAGLALSAIVFPIGPQFADAVENSSGSLETILLEIQNARKQMNAVPDLIKSEQWDGVRAILITPPLSDLWTKSARKSSLLQDYANVIGTTPTGDELAVLEAKEDVEGHLRFLDMAVYNNNFNPIKSVGEIGATKALISSYYDDPINEYKATVAALDNLIQLGDVKQ